jgi:hypothetical protein
MRILHLGGKGGNRRIKIKNIISHIKKNTPH